MRAPVSLVCPETLEPLEPVDGGLRAPRTGRTYPRRDDIQFLGFATRDAAHIQETMDEEHAWQGTPASIDRDIEFLRTSAPKAVDVINAALRLLPPDGECRSLELGAGSGWVSWLLAEAGCEAWMCDFEANSVAIGLQYQHERFGPDRRVVTDARFAPFADASFDLVLLKEFVHHISGFTDLFREANRVLRPGGLLVLMEPVRSVLTTVREMRTPDPHEGHVITWVDRYLRGLRRTGFAVALESAIYPERESRFPLIGPMRRRAAAGVAGLAPARSAFTRAHLRLLGDAEAVVLAVKCQETERIERPAMSVIDPATLVITPSERRAFSPLRGILHESATRLVRRTP